MEANTALATAPRDSCTHLECRRRALGKILFAGGHRAFAVPPNAPQGDHSATAAAAKDAPALIATQFAQRRVLRRVASRTRATRVAESATRAPFSAILADDRRTSRGTHAPRAWLNARSRPTKPRQKRRRSSRPSAGRYRFGLASGEVRLFAGGIDPPAILLAHRRPTRTPASRPKKKAKKKADAAGGAVLSTQE